MPDNRRISPSARLLPAEVAFDPATQFTGDLRAEHRSSRTSNFEFVMHTLCQLKSREKKLRKRLKVQTTKPIHPVLVHLARTDGRTLLADIFSSDGNVPLPRLSEATTKKHISYINRPNFSNTDTDPIDCARHETSVQSSRDSFTPTAPMHVSFSSPAAADAAKQERTELRKRHGPACSTTPAAV